MATAGAVDRSILSYAPPRAKSTRTTNTGLSSHTLAGLCSSCLARDHTQATRTNRAGGQNQPSASTAESGATSTDAPATAMRLAGATAQRCGWSVNRVDSTAKRPAEPEAEQHHGGGEVHIHRADWEEREDHGRCESRGQRSGHCSADVRTP